MNSATFSKVGLLGLAGLVLAACGDEAMTPAVPAEPAPMEVAAPAPAIDLSPVQLTLSAEDVADLGRPPNTAAEFSEEKGGIVMTGYVAEPISTGRTNGVNIEIDSDTEAKASGRRMTVTLTVKSADGTAQPFAAAYSTADVGNSGWRELEAGEAFSDVSFSYDVPERSAPGKDYLGILPTMTEDGAGVVVSMVKMSFAEMPSQIEN
jgi:hypothetical protein